MTWTGKVWSFGETPNDTQMTALQADITAKANGDSGAPKIQTAALSTGAVTEGKLANSAVDQSKLSTATGEVSGSPTLNIDSWSTLPGGEYGFYPQLKKAAAATSATAVIAGREYDGETATTYGYITSTAYATLISFKGAGTGVAYAQQRYVQSSPPYDLGDGPCHLFTFVLANKTTREILATYSAPEAPWHNNGPTNITRDRRSPVVFDEDTDWRVLRSQARDVMKAVRRGAAVTDEMLQIVQQWMTVRGTLKSSYIAEELPQSVKNADMTIIPHPFVNAANHPNLIVIMLDAVSDLSAYLAQLQQSGELSVSELLHEGFLKISNQISRIGPPGVPILGYRWR